MQRAVVSASLDRSVRLWDVGTGKQLSMFAMDEPVHQISANASGTDLLCACGSGELRSFDLNHGPASSGGSFIGHAGTVSGCQFSMDGSRAVSCSEVDRVRVWETRMRQCIAQAHASRNVQVTSVKIVQQTLSRPLPPFQGFHRLLTVPSDVPPVPIGTSGRPEALRDMLELHADSDEFIDRITWAQDAGVGSLAGSDEASAHAQEAKASEARWAAATAGLYDVIVAAGLDGKEVLESVACYGLREAAATDVPADSPGDCVSTGSHTQAVVVAKPEKLPVAPAASRKKRRKR